MSEERKTGRTSNRKSFKRRSAYISTSYLYHVLRLCMKYGVMSIAIPPHSGK